MISNFFNRFSSVGIFDDVELNVFFNQLYTFLINNLDETLVLDELMIDKDVALLLQDEAAGNISHISLTTTSIKIFDLIKRSAASLAISGYTIRDTVVELKFQTTLIHLEFTESIPLKISFNGITIRNKTDIK